MSFTPCNEGGSGYLNSDAKQSSFSYRPILQNEVVLIHLFTHSNALPHSFTSTQPTFTRYTDHSFQALMAPSSSSEELILVNREPTGIAFVTINRPQLLNSLTRPMMVDLAWAFKSLDADDSVRVIVLTGSGRAFCSGVDLTAAEEVFKGDVKDVEIDPVAQMERCRKPIIGAIAGFAVTAGFEIALACDILIAVKGTKFIDTHAR